MLKNFTYFWRKKIKSSASQVFFILNNLRAPYRENNVKRGIEAQKAGREKYMPHWLDG